MACPTEKEYITVNTITGDILSNCTLESLNVHYKELCEKKRRLQDRICALKAEIKIRPASSSKQLPRHIVEHPLFAEYQKLGERTRRIDAELVYTKKQIAQRGGGKSFHEQLCSLLYERHPEIFTVLRDEVRAKNAGGEK